MKDFLKFKKIDLSAWKKWLDFIYVGKIKFLLYILWIGVIGCAIYFWYDYITNQGWSEEQKKAYLDKREKDVVFDEKGFELVVESLEKRKEKAAKKIVDIPDIFRLK